MPQSSEEHELAAENSFAQYKQECEQKLHASERRYRGLLETSLDGILAMDLQGNILSVNQRSLAMLGFTSLEALQASGKKGFDFIVEPAWLSEPHSLLTRLLERSPQQLEFTYLRQDGSSHPAEMSLSLQRDAANQPDSVLSLCRDTTERKSNADQLRKLSLAVIHSGDNIVITDSEGRIEYVNPQFELNTGYSAAEAIGQNPRVLKSGAQSLEFYQQLWQTIKSGQIWRGELHNKRKDGSLYWEAASIAPVMDETGRLTHFVAIKKEVTAHKQLEQAMRIKDSAINSSINAIVLADLSGILTYVNPAFLDMLGYASQDQVLGKTVLSFWKDKLLTSEVLGDLRVGKSWTGDKQIRREDDSLVDVNISAHPVTDEAGRPLCMMCSFVDITARKQAERAELEEHSLADALRKTAEALSSTIKLDDVLELIIESARQVIAYDSMSIMLLEGQKLVVARHRGYAERGLKDYMEKSNFQIDDFPSMRAMLETRQPSILPDINNNRGWKQNSDVTWVRSYAGVPIVKRDKVIGFLNLDSATPNFFTPMVASRLKAFASQAAVAIENARLYEQDHILSITDGLTSLYNSRYFFELAKLEFERSQRYPGSLSLLMIDVDHFKEINDTYGHLVGDDVLREIARRMHACLRVVDIAARYGGEEFVILMSQTPEQAACQAAERMRQAVADQPFEIPDMPPVLVTISLGVASLAPGHHSLNHLIKSADQALYAAKAAGRNRISVWKQPEIGTSQP